MDFDDDEEYFNPYLPSSSQSPFPSLATGKTTSKHPEPSGELSFEDEQAILRALSDDDDAGFAASLQTTTFSDQSLQVWDPFPNPIAASGTGIPVTRSASGTQNGRLFGLEDRKTKENSGMSLVDPQWEIIDPTPDIWSLFNQFNKEYFWGKLTSVEVKWSKQMTTCAGICRYQSHAGYCSIGLSFPLLKFRPRKDLIETLLHEMIHAYLFVSKNDRDRESHGPFFHEHMFRINKQTGTNISVYHSFHDEVNHYKQHIWRCDGLCRYQRPYNGFVKRARNRAPSKNDLWWADHQAKCGGNFIKIHEPEGFGIKGKRKKEDQPPKPLPATQPTLDGFTGFRSPVKRKEKPTKIDVKLLGDKLPKSPAKRQTLLSLPSTSAGQTLAISPEIIDLTSPPPIKKLKISRTPGSSGPRRQLQLNSFFPPRNPIRMEKSVASGSPDVICVDL